MLTSYPERLCGRFGRLVFCVAFFAQIVGSDDWKTLGYVLNPSQDAGSWEMCWLVGNDMR